MTETSYTTQAEHEAFKLGCDAAKAAASWITDGNMDREERARVLRMIEDGDPQASDYLPAYPNLSGEWADDPTPRSLADDILGRTIHDAEIIDGLAQAWEAGVSETFERACEAELRAFTS